MELAVPASTSVSLLVEPRLYEFTTGHTLRFPNHVLSLAVGSAWEVCRVCFLPEAVSLLGPYVAGPCLAGHAFNIKPTGSRKCCWHKETLGFRGST